MRITSKGQVTIPQHIREAAGFLPHTEVEFVLEADGTVRMLRARPKSEEDERRQRHERIVAALEKLNGSATSGFTTDEIMPMTRGEDDDGDAGGQ